MSDPAVRIREATWRVRVYGEGDKPVDTWLIENRTEQEAESEAAADIANEYPNASDWTLTPELPLQHAPVA